MLDKITVPLAVLKLFSASTAQAPQFVSRMLPVDSGMLKNMTTLSKIRSIAIIGAGPAGLAAAKYVGLHPSHRDSSQFYVLCSANIDEQGTSSPRNASRRLISSNNGAKWEEYGTILLPLIK